MGEANDETLFERLVAGDREALRPLMERYGDALTLYRCLEKIPSDYREALYLVYIEDMNYDEAGAIMSKTRKQVDNLVSRGKAAMRKQLGEEGVFDEINR